MCFHHRAHLGGKSSKKLPGILLILCGKRGDEVDVRVWIGLAFVEPKVNHLVQRNKGMDSDEWWTSRRA